MAISRRRKPHLISRGRSLALHRGRLGFEQLESRLALSSASLAAYDHVSAAWFASANAGGDDRWIVRLTPQATAQAETVAGAAHLLAELPLTVVRGLGLPGQLLVSGRGVDAAALSAALSASSAVATFQRDASVAGAQLPNDPDVNNGVYATALSQYALFNIGQFDGTADADIDADLAWDITTGSASVVTAVIDTGIYTTHPDLAANIWTNPGETAGDGLDNDGNGFVDDVHGWDFRNHDNDPLDDNGHGTHVAGAIGAVGNNATGVVGVNWTTSLLPLKFLDANNVGSVVDAVAAINYTTMMRTRAVNPVNIRVINASWGGAGVDDPALRAAIAASGAADILFVAAAGNGDVFGRGQNIDELPFYPASFPLDNILVVGATDRNDNLANFSNYGVTTVDIAAPGLSVWNTNLFLDNNTTLPNFGVRTGTSMAAPLAAGSAALAWASAPTATLAEVRDAILAGGDAKASLTGNVASGRRLNAYGALVTLPPQAATTSALDVTAIGGASYQFTVSLTSNAGIVPGTVGNGDFVVRRKGTTGSDLTASLVSSSSSNANKQWTATYQVTPPGGSWDVLDGGTYEIVLVAGALVDVNGIPSRQKPVDEFNVDLSSIGVFRPTVFTDGGPGSLREAISLANAITPEINPAGGTVILAPGTYTLSVPGAGEDANASGDLDITGNITIAGDGTGDVTIVTGPWDRVFDVRPGATFNLNGVKLQEQALTPFVAPLVAAGGDVTIQMGVTFTSHGAFTDADSTSFSATVNYGEGAGSQSLAVNPDKTFALSNLYEAAGTYTVTVAVSDPQGQTDSQQFVVTVRDSSPGGAPSLVLTATLTTGAGGDTIAVGDLTGDGIADVTSGNRSAGTLSVFPGNGDGTFQSPMTVSGIGSQEELTLHDLNRDGILDAIVPNTGGAASGGIHILLGTGSGAFAAPVYYDTGGGRWFADGVVVRDFDGDGHDDLAILNYGAWSPYPPSNGSVRFLWGQGDGTFEVGVNFGIAPRMMDLVAGNIDADPQLELLAISGETFHVFAIEYAGGRQFQANDVTGGFTAKSGSGHAIAEDFYASTLIDLNGDAKLDFAVVDSQADMLHVLLGNGDGVFQQAVDYPTGDGPLELVAGDLNSDDHPDLVISGIAGSQVFANQGDGTFASQPHFNVATSIDTALSDFDGNGTLDVAVLREDGSNQVLVYLNQGLAGNPHLAVATPDSVRNGEAFPVVVTIHDSAGNVRTDFTGAVAFKSSLTGAQLPTNYTFTPVDAGVRTFWLTRATAGEETLSVHLASDMSRFARAEFELPPWDVAEEVRGGGLRNAGMATLERVEITGFAASQGGGILNTGALTVSDSLIDGNTAVTTANPVEAASSEFRINLTTSGAQSQPSVDINPSGRAVVSWTTQQATEDVAARLIDSSGTLSNELTIWAGGAADRNPDVTIAHSGEFVVAYESFGVDASGYGIDGIRFDALGNPLNAPNQRISIPSVGAPGDQLEPMLIGLGDGSFIATWFDNAGNDGSGWGVHARRFDQNGVAIGNQFTVSSTTTGDQQSIQGADVDANGFVLAWNGNGTGDSLGAYARLFNTNGVAVGPEFRLSDATAGIQETPRAVLLGDKVAFIWVAEGSAAEQGTYLRFFNRAGIALGSEIRLSTASPAEPDTRVRIPDVARVSDDRFVVVWEEPNGDGSGLAISMQLYSSTGIAVAPAITVNTTTAGDQLRPAVASNGDNKVVVVWQGNGTGDDSGIFARTFTIHPEANGGGIANFGVATITSSTINDNSAERGGGVYNAGTLTVASSTISENSAARDGGGVYNAGTLTATNVTASGNEAANQGGGIYNSTAGAATLANSTITNNFSSGDQASGYLTQSTETFRINQNFATEHEISLDVNSQGDALVAWTRTYGGTDRDVYYQILSDLQHPVGAGDYMANSPHNAEVIDPAVGLRDNGGHLIAYMGWGYGTNGFGIRRGVWQPSQLGVISGTSANLGYEGSIRMAVNASGASVIGWVDSSSRDGSGYGVFARRFDDTPQGSPVTGDFQVNQSTAGTQWLSDVVMFDDNTMFFVYFGSGASDPDSYGAFGRFFAANGTPLTDEFRLTTSYVGEQRWPSAALSGNGLVVIWSDSTAGAVRGQRLDRSGNFLGSEFTVTSFSPSINNHDDRPSISALPGGGFTVTWSAVTPETGSLDIYARDFDSQNRPVGAAYHVDSYRAGTQTRPLVDSAADGSTLFVWQGEGLGDDQGVLARKYSYQIADAPGVFVAAGSSFTVTNSIVAGNDSLHDAPDVQGTFISQGGNLIGKAAAASGFSQLSDLTGSISSPLDPHLGPLLDNGGPTKTHLPATTSPAIDAGVAAGAPATDQRGVARPADGDNNGTATVDIGAVERYYASISGRKFKDQNQNGVQDVGEIGIANWTMYLDLDQDGQFDAGEPTTVTDAQGDYAFQQLTPGVYTIAEVNQPGWTRTYLATTHAGDVQEGVGGVGGLTGVHELSISPDGKHAYAINNDAGADKLVTFARNATTGALTFVAALTNNQNDTLGMLVTGLEGEGHVVVSPDGAFVYALGTSDNAFVVFARNATTGVLTFITKFTNANTGMANPLLSPNDVASAIATNNNQNAYVAANSGLYHFLRSVGTGNWSLLQSRPQAGAAVAVAVPTDGAHVYTSNGSNIVAFTRTVTSGTLSTDPLFSFSNGQPASGGGTADGLTDVTDLAMSADGLFLYTLSRGDQSIGVYKRTAATGVLQFVEKITAGGADSLGTIVGALEGAKSLAVSAIGDRVYVTSDAAVSEDDALVVIQRNATTGRLHYLHSLKQLGEDGLGNFIQTLSEPDGVAVSPDGKSIYVAARDGSITLGAVTQFFRDGQGLDRKTLLVGQDLADVNFSSYAAPAEIHGVVYNDLNNDGVRNVDEYGLTGVVVYLDANGNNQFDNGELTATTDVLGQYSFLNLAAPASYTVRANLPASQSVTSPSAASSREWSLVLNPDQTYVGADFLVHSALAGQGTSQISGIVWQDSNGDGVRQGIEPFLAGRQVYLDVNDNGAYNAGVDILASSLTSVTGNYAFTGLGASNFVVRVVTNPGELTTSPVGNSFTKQSLTTGANPLGLVTAKFSNDNLPDLASVDGSSDKVSVRMQLAGGGFDTRAEYAVGSQPTGIVVGKFNNDAFPDIAVVHWALSKVVFLINNGSGVFSRSAAATEISVSSGYTTIAVADVDLDGDDDLAVAVDGANDFVHILRNNNGAVPAFSDIQQIPLGTAGPLSIAAGDLTGDGRSEFIVGNFDDDNVRVIRNDAAGTSFALQSPVTVGDGPSSVAIVPDMNNDGMKDVVVASIGANVVTILRGNGNGGFLLPPTVIPVGQGPRSVTVADVDNDNDLDLIVGNSLSNDVVVLRRQGAGLTFSFPESSGLASFSSLVASGVKHVLATDLDNNGVLDLAAVRGDANGGSLAVLSNALAPGSLRLTLSGANTVSNQDFGVAVTAPAHLGDYDGNLRVDGSDFLRWQRMLGSAATPAGSGADGSANGTVDAADLAVWRNHFGQSYAVVEAASAAVIAAADSESTSTSDSANDSDSASDDALFGAAPQTTLVASRYEPDRSRAFRPLARGRFEKIAPTTTHYVRDAYRPLSASRGSVLAAHDDAGSARHFDEVSERRISIDATDRVFDGLQEYELRARGIK